MIDWLTDLLFLLILNFRVLLDNPTANDSVQWLRLLSLALALLVTLRWVVDQALGRRLRSDSQLCRDPQMLAHLEYSARQMGLKQAPELRLLREELPMAFSHGLFRPVVFVSSRLLRWLSNSELAAVLTHETAHVARRDSLRYWIREVAWALTPLLVIQIFAVRFLLSPTRSEWAWWGAIGLVLAFRLLTRPWDFWKEKTCDDATIRVTGDPLALARALLKFNRLASESHTGTRPVSARAMIGRGSQLSPRVLRLIDYAPPPRRRCPWVRAGLVGASATLILVSTLLLGADQHRQRITSIWAAPCPSVLIID